MKKRVAPEGGFRTRDEQKVPQEIAKVFQESPGDVASKLENFPRYIRRQKVTRFIALYEIFKRILPVKGSIIECGVYQGFGLMTWANLSAVLEPNNLTRRIYGFDTFEGFKEARDKDKGKGFVPEQGDLKADSYSELLELIRIYDSNRFLGHVPKVFLFKGDATITIPQFVKENKHLVVSLLFLDMDLFEPTKVAIGQFFSRMPKGAIIAFDELDNPIWPGETMAVLETVGMGKLRIERFDFDPYIGFAVIE